ncbi:phosphopantetheine-binding protein [Vibrio sp. PP-XX7]
MEERLAEIWQTLLGVAQVGRHDHFFELGGHSLLAVQLISRIRQEFSIEMTVSTLFEYPRLKAFAERLVYLKLSAFKMSDLERLASQLFQGK